VTKPKVTKNLISNFALQKRLGQNLISLKQKRLRPGQKRLRSGQKRLRVFVRMEVLSGAFLLSNLLGFLFSYADKVTKRLKLPFSFASFEREL
jgi:hypothetical protein